MANIESYSKCECGAITINFDNGASNSMYPKTAKKIGLDLRNIKNLLQLIVVTTALIIGVLTFASGVVARKSANVLAEATKPTMSLV